MNINEYIEERVDKQQTYFSKTADKNKKRFEAFSISKLAISLIISIVSTISGDGSCWSILIAIMSALIAFVEGLMFIKKYNEKWINSRLTSEKIKKEKYFFLTKTEKYESTNKAENIFVQNIEAIISDSNEQWKNITSKERRE